MNTSLPILIIGGGPAGLIAAETLGKAGFSVILFDRMPTPARKFLMAGHGGLNLTNSEAFESFLTRYGESTARLAPALSNFPPQALRAWAEGLGQETFVGTSGRVFPRTMKAAPLVRAWKDRLKKLGISLILGHRWIGWNEEGALLFETKEGQTQAFQATATLLALGGASWPHLGSDARWTEILKARGVPLMPFEPSNCGFVVPWSSFFSERFAGKPLKPAALTFESKTLLGEVMLTQTGLEGGPVYALSGALRKRMKEDGKATLFIDVRPGLLQEELVQKLGAPRGSQSLSTFLRKTAGLSPQAIGLLRETTPKDSPLLRKPETLAERIKKLPVELTATGSLSRALSSAGGIKWEAIDENFMLRDIPGVFVAGEMLDWDAPTGGYLLQACFSTGKAAAQGMQMWLGKRAQSR